MVIRPGAGALVSTGHFQRKSAQYLRVVPIRHRTASAFTQLRVLRPIRSWMLTMNEGGRGAAISTQRTHCSLQSYLKIQGRDAGARRSAQICAQPMREADEAPRYQDKNVHQNNGGVPLSLRFTLPPSTKCISIGRVVHYVGCTSHYHAVHSCRGWECIWDWALLSRAPVGIPGLVNAALFL